MFSYTGLTPSQVYALKDKYHIYLLKSGRASISGCKLPLPFPFPGGIILTILPSEREERRLRRASHQRRCPQRQLNEDRTRESKIGKGKKERGLTNDDHEQRSLACCYDSLYTA